MNYTETAHAEREPNQSIAEATPITLEKTYSGSINATGDKDYYKFTLGKKNTIAFVFTLPELSDNSKYWAVKVYDNTNAEVENFTIYGDETTQKFGGKTYSAGDYYVMISCADKITRKTYQFYVTTKHVVHAYETSVLTDPTCTEKSYITETCACGHSRVFTFADALGHDYYVDNVVNATCTAKGYTTYVCWRCGDSYKDDYVNARGHNYKNGKCTRCGASDPNYTISVSFKDVAKNAWYKEAVDYAVSNGLMNGMGNNKFEPDTATNRAMLVTILWRYAGSPSGGTNNFNDVANGQWFTKAVTWAARRGIVTGVGNNKFDPEGKLTREQLATILFRYAKMRGKLSNHRASFTRFSDGKKVQSWSKEAMQWAVAEGIIGGTTANGKLYLDPQGNATRAQVATILMRFIENVLK